MNNQSDPADSVLVLVTGPCPLPPLPNDEYLGAYPVVLTSVTTPASNSRQSDLLLTMLDSCNIFPLFTKLWLAPATIHTHPPTQPLEKQ